MAPAPLDRRGFLRAAACAGLGAGLAPLLAPVGAGAAEAPRVRRRVRLGRTGLELPDIGFGTSSLRGDEALVRHALERGVTHFDTAESYGGGAAESTLGRALRGRREEVTLASKVKAGADARWPELMRSLEGSLRRLGTDRIDVYFNHAVNDVDRLRNPEWAELAKRAREQGKIRFTGLSGHAGKLVECVDFALDEDLVDVLLLAYNFGQDPAFHENLTRSFDFVAKQPDLPRVLEKARRKDVGVVAMKTLRGARLNDLRPYETGGATFAQAAFRWVLSDPKVDALVVTMKSEAQVDEYLGASGWTERAPEDAALLLRYEERNGATQCRYGCRACEAACPQEVPIPEVLRCGMYARDYGDPALARASYAELPRGAEACLRCSAQPCASACPFGLPVSELTTAAGRALDRGGGAPAQPPASSPVPGSRSAPTASTVSASAGDLSSR